MNDTISRQEAIDTMRKLPKWNIMREDYKNVGFSYDDVMFTLEKLSPAQSQQKRGKWVHDGCKFKGGNDWVHCSECGHLGIMASKSNFCPSCGADMRSDKG